MSIKLPEIDVDAISSLDEAKQVIKQLLNSFELVLKELDVVKKENELLKQEIARLKRYHTECCVPMTDGGTQDRRRLIEALAKGMEETA